VAPRVGARRHSVEFVGDERNPPTLTAYSHHASRRPRIAAFAEREWSSMMAKMCPISGCKSCVGMCVHDKMMVGMMVMAMLGGVAHWGMHWI
jgi:hypothetical protein